MVSSIAPGRALLGLALCCLGCASSARNEPSLEEKCSLLEEYCVELPGSREDLAECHDVGRRGRRNPEHRDRCFLAYDECFDDCYYLYLLRDVADGG